MTTTCPKCSFPIPVAKSRRVQVCKNCKSISETGKSLKEIAREKHRESMERSRLRSKAKSDLKPKTVYVIKNRSAKGEKQEREVSKTKTELKRAALDGGFVQCCGCLNFFDVIDASHIVPVSQSSALASNPANITLLCRQCHTVWENMVLPQVVDLACFLEDMKYLYRADNGRFWRLFQKMLDYHEKVPTPKLERVLGKIEKFET